MEKVCFGIWNKLDKNRKNRTNLEGQIQFLCTVCEQKPTLFLPARGPMVSFHFWTAPGQQWHRCSLLTRWQHWRRDLWERNNIWTGKSDCRLDNTWVFFLHLIILMYFTVQKMCWNLHNPLYCHQDPGVTQRQTCTIQDKEWHHGSTCWPPIACQAEHCCWDPAQETIC